MKSNNYFSLNIRKPDIHLALFACIIVALILAGVVAYQYRLLSKDLSQIESENAELTAILQSSEEQNTYLLAKTQEQEQTIVSLGGQISSIGKTVGTLEKLAKTDEELLKKYSKIYFLNENYVPSKLTEIDKKYVYNGTTNSQIHTDVWPHLKKLLDEAKEEDIDLLVASAFRSFGTQAALKSNYKVTYGSGANTFSADQGYSEHQLGTAVDFTTSKLGGLFSSFETDPAYQWLLKKAYIFGFIISYPKNNGYYKFEPWHWRYVGVELATYLHEEGIYFYDLDQRKIDAYLVRLFD